MAPYRRMAHSHKMPYVGLNERLIAEIKHHPWLFDCSRLDYLDKSKRDDSWNAIASSMCIPKADIERRWRSLRDRYGKELKLKNRKSGDRPGKKSKWHLFEVLDFLRAFMKPRQSCRITPEENGLHNSNSNETSSRNLTPDIDTCALPFKQIIVHTFDNDDDNNSLSPLDDFQMNNVDTSKICFETLSSDPLPEEHVEVALPDKCNTTTTTSKTFAKSRAISRKYKRKQDARTTNIQNNFQTDDEMLQLLRTSKEQLQMLPDVLQMCLMQQQSAGEARDDVHHFLLSLGSRMRALPARLKTELQIKMLQALLQAEEEAAMR